MLNCQVNVCGLRSLVIKVIKLRVVADGINRKGLSPMGLLPEDDSCIREEFIVLRAGMLAKVVPGLPQKFWGKN